MIEIAISECDHVAMDEEKKVFSDNNITMKLYHCKTEDDLAESLQKYEFIGVQYAPLTDRVFSNLRNLRAVVRYGVGVDNIDLESATRHGIKVSNVPNYCTEEVANHALTLMMALARKLIPIDNSVRSGNWNYEVSAPVYRFSEMTVGIVGLGRIGKCFAKQVRGLGVKIIATDPLYPNGIDEEYAFVEMVEFDELLTRSDFISIHCPFETTNTLFGEKELKRMKDTAYLINVSRGGIVGEAALIKALENKWIAGAASDVLAKEPPDGYCPLLACDNYIGTPHMAWYSVQASSELKRKLAEEIVRYVNEIPPLYQLN